MALESLLALVKTLSKRIEEHGEALRKNEALTRTALIDPLLRELGWNMEDPAQVVPEYPTENNENPDYVLLTNKKRLMVIEAKSLDSSLHEKSSKKDPVTQANNYASRSGIGSRYFSVTNGRHWEIYDRQRLGALHEMKVSQFDITESPAKVCVKALALWRPSLIEPSADSDWIPLSEFEHQQGDKPPSTLKFPEGKTVEINWWYELVTKTTDRLFETGSLNDGHCPIKRGRRYIVDSSDRALGGAKGSKEIRTVHGAVYVNTRDNAPNHIKNACRVIERSG